MIWKQIFEFIHRERSDDTFFSMWILTDIRPNRGAQAHTYRQQLHDRVYFADECWLQFSGDMSGIEVAAQCSL